MQLDVPLSVAPWLEVSVPVCVGVPLDVRVPLGVAPGLGVAVPVWVAVPELDAVTEPVVVGVLLPELDVLCVPVIEAEALCVSVCDFVAVELPEPELLDVDVAVGVAETLGDRV